MMRAALIGAILTIFTALIAVKETERKFRNLSCGQKIEKKRKNRWGKFFLERNSIVNLLTLYRKTNKNEIHYNNPTNRVSGNFF